MPIPSEVLQGNIEFFRRITAPLELHFQRMQFHGSPISEEVLRFKAKAWLLRMQEAAQEVYDSIGTTFNFDSPKQVKDILYGKPSDGIHRLGFEPVLQFSKSKREMTETVSQYAFGYLSYHHKAPVLRPWSLYRRLRHRYSNFVIKYLRYEPCQACTDDTKSGCEKCAGTRVGEIMGYDPRIVTAQGDHWRVHPNQMLLAVSGRPICLDPNQYQIPRDSKTWDISCRDIYVTRPGYKFVAYDLAKAERFMGGFLFDDAKMLEEVAMGSRAFSIMASEVLGIPEEQCSKGTDWYTAMKVAAYSSQYFVQAQTIHEFLMKQDIFIPIDVCKQMLQALQKRYSHYYENVMYYTWEWLTHRDPPYVRAYQGGIFRATKPVEIEGYTSYKQFIHSECKARTAFFEMCRKFASYAIQASATGLNCQADTLLLCDEIDRLTKPSEWKDTRFENGDWNLVAPLWTTYDSLIVEAREDFVEPVKKLFETLPGKFLYMKKYLRHEKVLDGLQLGVDVEKPSVQWGVEPDARWKEMTKEKNSRHFYDERSVRFKA